jgi:hypothetical protein
MADVKELIEGLRQLVGKADNVTRMNKEIDVKLYLQIEIARDYLDRRLNEISRMRAA